MKSFEPVYRELEELFIQILPDYIEKINKEYNDGIVLKPLMNTKLEEDCLRLPCFKFNIMETETSEKDRIIENTNYSVSFEIKLCECECNKVAVFWRYIEAVNRMFAEIESNIIYKITFNFF